ncbi:MAG: OpgC domain-containing protein [Hyphomicrobiales bacterium]|nr:OpgC domain-containing protein [Hyphomicrobiales bacterium]
MLTEVAPGAAAPGAMAARQPSAKPPRDQRLDFFRGLGMLIIFLAHAPGNPWNNWIPARFGFSSATELFVFCSGLASAFAFGGIFVRRGWFLGTARIAQRVWQVYWAHIGLFVALAALAVLVQRLGWGDAYYQEHIEPIARDPGTAVLGLVTLCWLPGYLDILPMYLIILGLIPVMMALRRLHASLPFVLSLLMYLSVWLLGFNLTGNPWTGFGWFFNPFGWQLVFFAGFAIGMKWLTPPEFGQKPLVIVCAVFVAAVIPLSFWGFQNAFPVLARLHDAVLFGNEKTDMHILRLVHFLAVAYVVLSLVAAFKPRLDAGLGRHIVKVGQQSLASFLLSLVFARLAGVALDISGREALPTAVVNLAGLALIIAGAHAIGWFKSAPWAKVSGKQITDQ